MFIPARRPVDFIGKDFGKVCELIPDGPSEASLALPISLVIRFIKAR
jgi:hypothetical protein